MNDEGAAELGPRIAAATWVVENAHSPAQRALAERHLAGLRRLQLQNTAAALCPLDEQSQLDQALSGFAHIAAFQSAHKRDPDAFELLALQTGTVTERLREWFNDLQTET